MDQPQLQNLYQLKLTAFYDLINIYTEHWSKFSYLPSLLKRHHVGEVIYNINS